MTSEATWLCQILSKIVYSVQVVRNSSPTYVIFLFLHCRVHIYICIKVKWSHYRPGVAQSVGRGIAVLFHDRGTRRGWVVSSTPRSHFIPGKDPVPILQEAGWAPGPVWTGGKSHPHRDSIPDRPARSQSLYRPSYPAHTHTHTHTYIHIYIYQPPAQWVPGLFSGGKTTVGVALTTHPQLASRLKKD